MNDNLFICEICKENFANLNGLSHHIKKTHKLEQKEYYDKFIKKPDEGICPCCGKNTSYNRFGYRRFCSIKCNGLYTLQQTPVNISKRIKAIQNSKNIKLSHNTKEFIDHQSKVRTEYYKNEENRKIHKESLQNLPPRTKEYKELKSIQQSEIINTFKNLQHYNYNPDFIVNGEIIEIKKSLSLF